MKNNSREFKGVPELTPIGAVAWRHALHSPGGSEAGLGGWVVGSALPPKETMDGRGPSYVGY